MYIVCIGTSIILIPFSFVSSSIFVSNSNRSPFSVKSTFIKDAGIARSPVCVSLAEIPVSSLITLLVHRLPNDDLAGILSLSFEKSLTPRIRAFGSSRSLAIHASISPTVCCPSESIVTHPIISGYSFRQKLNAVFSARPLPILTAW